MYFLDPRPQLGLFEFLLSLRQPLLEGCPGSQSVQLEAPDIGAKRVGGRRQFHTQICTSLTCLMERKRATHMAFLPISLVFYRTSLIVKQYYN